MRSPKNPPILQAVFGGDSVALRSAIEAGEDVNALDRDRRTPLFQAIVDGRDELVSQLLENGANVNVRDKEGKTALHFAAIHYQPESAKLLLAQGAMIDAPDHNGNTALSDAVFYSKGRGSMIELLIDRGADPRLDNLHGVSPEALARSVGNYDVHRFFKR